MANESGLHELVDKQAQIEKALLELRSSGGVELIPYRAVIDVMLTSCTFMLDNLRILEHNLTIS